MRIAYTFRNVESSEGLKNYAEEKIGKLQKYLRTPLEAEVVFSMERHLHQVDVSVNADGHRYASTDESENMYASIDLAIDKLDRQVRDAKATATTNRRHPQE
ncbi:MAG TPA: ribosome-associated translation inhibitor RaiA [Polyangiaceae bacterium LLY-WYZ-14_1]|jgi:putative sigma-54 modulation protein|nr:ribosome-associated translation inhibitor RaiA [Polyangiaceae bacterium LLY-WYZ-14_1]